MRVEVGEEHTTVEVRDDGSGGAHPAQGSGLSGLADRVSALGGTLEIESPVGVGTTIRARIPVTGPGDVSSEAGDDVAYALTPAPSPGS